MTINWTRFVEIVKSHQRFLLISHIRPDCDALGSELGMAGVLEALGKDVVIVNGHATPANLQFIDPQRKIKQIGVDVQPAELDDVEVLMILDTSAWAQIGEMGPVIKASQAIKMVLDHHVGEDDLGAELFKNTSAEATGRLVAEAAAHLDVGLTPEIATPLFAAVATDTGWYHFNSTSAGTYALASRLVAAGANPTRIYHDLYEQDTLARLRLRGIILSRTQTEIDGRLSHTAVLQEDFKVTGALPTDTEDVVNLTMAVKGVEVAVILVEQASGGFKISFRSTTPAVNCSQLAAGFGGGGHKAAAGAFVAGSFAEAQPKVLDAVRAAMR